MPDSTGFSGAHTTLGHAHQHIDTMHKPVVCIESLEDVFVYAMQAKDVDKISSIPLTKN
ncbi:hypothetical protein BH11PSE12_BH11PSE12_31780 [soil metagenome]